jgi:hypothetical protein
MITSRKFIKNIPCAAPPLLEICQQRITRPPSSTPYTPNLQMYLRVAACQVPPICSISRDHRSTKQRKQMGRGEALVHSTTLRVPTNLQLQQGVTNLTTAVSRAACSNFTGNNPAEFFEQKS